MTASTELFAIAVTMAGAELPPAVIVEASVPFNHVDDALEVFRGGARKHTWPGIGDMRAHHENSRTSLSRHHETLGKGLDPGTGA
jgi:hypothetical protein